MKDLIKMKYNIEEKKRISSWLDSMDIQNYTINEDYTVDVDGEVFLAGIGLTEIPIQFGKVTDFYCHDNCLTSLKGCPIEVRDIFNCENNRLTSLKFCPQIIGGDFDCEGNQLTSLLYAPKRPTYFNNNTCSMYYFDSPLLEGHVYCLEKIVENPKETLLDLKETNRIEYSLILFESRKLRTLVGTNLMSLTKDYIFRMLKNII